MKPNQPQLLVGDKKIIVKNCFTKVDQRKNQKWLEHFWRSLRLTQLFNRSTDCLLFNPN